MESLASLWIRIWKWTEWTGQDARHLSMSREFSNVGFPSPFFKIGSELLRRRRTQAGKRMLCTKLLLAQYPQCEMLHLRMCFRMYLSRGCLLGILRGWKLWGRRRFEVNPPQELEGKFSSRSTQQNAGIPVLPIFKELRVYGVSLASLRCTPGK